MKSVVSLSAGALALAIAASSNAALVYGGGTETGNRFNAGAGAITYMNCFTAVGAGQNQLALESAIVGIRRLAASGALVDVGVNIYAAEMTYDGTNFGRGANYLLFSSASLGGGAASLTQLVSTGDITGQGVTLNLETASNAGLGGWWIGALLADPLALWVYGGIVDREGIDAAAPLAETVALVRDIAVSAFGLLAFGFVSRRFERQADTNAVRLLSERDQSADATPASVNAMAGALSMVAFVNHVPVERPSWRHGSIAWRQAYLRTLAGRPHARLGIDSLVRAICALALVAVLAMLTAAFVLRDAA
jgi:hypothetical protein